ncbi:hypothetical protein BDZ89DRAFT_798283 [Hymenopellis radicata]|nr:hypothetical protein BDZ89DRAFT_798283 [Hymenopellis radicata]
MADYTLHRLQTGSVVRMQHRLHLLLNDMLAAAACVVAASPPSPCHVTSTCTLVFFDRKSKSVLHHHHHGVVFSTYASSFLSWLCPLYLPGRLPLPKQAYLFLFQRHRRANARRRAVQSLAASNRRDGGRNGRSLRQASSIAHSATKPCDD